MTEVLLKKYPKKVDQQKRREYKLEIGQEAYVKKEPKVSLDMRKADIDREVKQ